MREAAAASHWITMANHTQSALRIGLVLATVLGLVGGQLWNPRRQGESSTTSPDSWPELTIPFQLVSGTLVLLPEHDGDPVVERLCLVTAGTTLRIVSLQLLAGHVRIRGPSEALAYVRLPTSPVTRDAMRTGRAGESDVLRYDEITSELLYGRNSLVTLVRKGTALKWPGILTAVEAVSMGYRPPSVTDTPPYVVRRTLLIQASDGRRRFARVTERVTSHGAYERVYAQRFDAPIPMRWHSLPPQIRSMMGNIQLWAADAPPA